VIELTHSEVRALPGVRRVFCFIILRAVGQRRLPNRMCIPEISEAGEVRRAIPGHNDGPNQGPDGAGTSDDAFFPETQ
jgi:hypothetical protein